MFRQDRGSLGGGLCVYIKDIYKASVIGNLSNISENSFQQLWLKVICKKLKSFLLCTVYRPPNTPISFLEILSKSFMDSLLVGSEVVILGDLNCNVLEDCYEGRALTEFCSTFNLTQLVESPTRVTETSKSIIDIVLTTNKDFVENCVVKSSSISDHNLVCFNLKLKAPRPRHSYVTIRSYKNYDRDNFLVDLSRVPFHMVYFFESLDDQVDAFNCLFLEVLDVYAPFKRIKIKSRPNPFITQEIKQLMKTRDLWHKTAKRTSDRLHWNAYRFFRQEVKREIRLAEKAYVRTELQNSKGNSNAIWKVINRCLPRKGAPLKTENPLSLSKTFNEFYTSVGKATADKARLIAREFGFSPSGHGLLHNYANDVHENDHRELFMFSAVTESLVENIVNGLPSNKAPGADKITSRVLKDSLPAILPIITHLFNKSFATGTFARSWKMAEVIPVPKSGDFNEPVNTRPISLLPILSKVCERLAHRQFVDFLNRSGKISKFQSGNRELHSTETALLQFTDDILKNMDEKKVSLIVLLDMSKAFDSIQHERLLMKLHKIGISTAAWTWFESYLTKRSQFVRIEDAISDPLPLNFGVPQGSILGPVLFTVYVNDLLSVPKHCKSSGYVDDTKIFLSLPPRDITDASNALNQDLLEISRWCCENSLLINPDKTKFLVIATPQLLRNLPRLSITILGKEIEPVSVARDLGVYIDQTLNYNEHISKLVSNCVHKLVQINRIKHLLDRKSLLLMINAFVFSKLFYCSTVWGNTSKSNIKKLQLVQNFAGKIVLGLKKFDHISQGLKSLGWLSIEDKLRLNTAVMVHKCLQHRVPIYLKDKFVYRSQVHNRQLRSVDNNELNLPHCRLSTGQRSFAFRGAKVWNSLPLDLKLTSSLRTFKKNVCELLVNNLS